MKGISPFISLAITVLLITMATALILNVLNPLFNRVSDSSIVNEARQNLELMNSLIEEVTFESQGSRRTVSLTVTDGEYKIDTTNESIYWDYNLKSDFSIEGVIGNVYASKISPNVIKLSIAYTDIDFNSTIRIARGSHRLIVENMGKNETTDKIIVKVSTV
jgi:hypothetical protein